MVFNRIKEAFSGNDEKYEILYYKYSKIKLENQKLKQQHLLEMKEHKSGVHRVMAEYLISIYQDIETAKISSFKVKATDKNLQKLLIDLNKAEKNIREVMKKFSIEEITANERFYDPEIHDIASYEDAKGMAKGLVLKTIKKGFKYRNEIIKKPKLLVTR